MSEIKKIEKLTPEQEAQFAVYRDKWIAIGLSMEPANRPEAEAAIVKAYAVAGLAAPRIVWCGSPLSQGFTRAIVLDKKLSSIGESVRDSVGESVGESVRASVRESVWDSVGDSLGASGCGQHDANWVGFYDFFRTVCALTYQTDKLCGINTITRNAGWFLPYKKICWVAERHNVLKRNAQGRLHCDGSAAVAYPDGWEIFFLNGVRVKKEYAVTPAEKILPETILAETNADIRRELIRKVGVERMLDKLPHKELSVRGNYQLLSVDLGGEAREARYLKMVNPSIGCYHLEGVGPECNTVEEALNFRNANWFEDAEALT